jgi:hypothetical protein
MSESMIVERLALIEPDWADVTRRSQHLQKQHFRRRALLTGGVMLGAALLAGAAFAAVRVWMGHDMTPADIAHQATVVTNDKWLVCSSHNQCTAHTGTHKEINILPSMGVVFVLPKADGRVGYSLYLVPAEGLLVPTPPPGWGTEAPTGEQTNPSGGTWSVQRPDGNDYTVSWNQASGAVSEHVTNANGQSQTIPLQAGDVVPLIPGSLADQPRTLDKAITFDLPSGTRVIIFPQLNETYIGGVQTPSEAQKAQPLAPGEAAKYGLTPIGQYNGKLPVTPSGGTWTADLPGGLTRTISWHAGDSFVTVTDTTAHGTNTTQVPIGHELPLVPFK